MSSLQAACAFCDRSQFELLHENESAFAIRDKYPVRRLHSLVLPKRHVADMFDLAPEELQAVFQRAKLVRDGIAQDDPDAGGFNFGKCPRRDHETPRLRRRDFDALIFQ